MWDCKSKFSHFLANNSSSSDSWVSNRDPDRFEGDCFRILSSCSLNSHSTSLNTFSALESAKILKVEDFSLFRVGISSPFSSLIDHSKAVFLSSSVQSITAIAFFSSSSESNFFHQGFYFSSFVEEWSKKKSKNSSQLKNPCSTVCLS